MKKKKADINSYNLYGVNALFYAVRSEEGNDKIITLVKYLFSQGIDYDTESSFSKANIFEPINYDVIYKSLTPEQSEIKKQLEKNYIEFYNNFSPVKDVLIEHKKEYDDILNYSKRLKKMYQECQIQLHNYYERWNGYDRLMSLNSISHNISTTPTDVYFGLYKDFLERNWSKFIYRCMKNKDKFCCYCCKYNFSKKENCNSKSTPYYRIVKCEDEYYQKNKSEVLKFVKYNNNKYYCSEKCYLQDIK